MSTDTTDDYFRGDQEDGITGPDLSKDCTFAEHIVRARGKRTQLTSVSKDAAKILDFGEAIYQLISELLKEEGHRLIEHRTVMDALRESVRLSEKAERARSIQAIRYCEKRLEGLVEWSGFDFRNVERKDLIRWAEGRVQRFFRKA